MIQQIAQSLPDSVREITVVKTPIPGSVGVFVRWLLNLPTWIQITGAAVAAVIGIVVLRYLWKRRKAMWIWFTTRSRGTKIAVGGLVAAGVAAFIAFGAVSWHYMMHNNEFCGSCHVMTSAYTRFQHSEHSKLQCHDCHQQSIFVSARQLVLWVAEKPQVIPPHAKVPNKVCGECHLQKPGQDSIWKRISATAGHHLHLNSTKPALKDMQCTTCHGVDVHHFAPENASCGQAGCHDKLPMKLAKMKDQTELHCTKCHQFTLPVAENISIDSAKQALNPTFGQCLGCHDMKKALGNYDLAADPHKGVCGSCHNPHTQETPQAAWTSCANSGCHENAVALTPFHKGIAAASLQKCSTCHQAHTWAVSGDKCIVCHSRIYEDRPASVTASAGGTPARLASSGGAPAYSGSEKFSHNRHRGVTCTSCHGTGTAHGALLVKTEADCQRCHHSTTAGGAMSGAPARTCTSCHASAQLRTAIAETLTVQLSVWKAPRARVLAFPHDQHSSVACVTCHSTPVTMAVPANGNCASCHDKHHTPDNRCMSCHDTPKAAHTREAHLGCQSAQCHAPQSVSTLKPQRNVCLTCHSDKVNHKPGKECAACHQVEWLTAQKGT